MVKLELLKSLCLDHLLISAMNNNQIQQILSRIPTQAVGAFAVDQIPLAWTRPIAFISNTQRHNKSGLHWVAIYVNKNGDVWYSDSFGVPLTYPIIVTQDRVLGYWRRGILNKIKPGTLD